MGTATHFEFKDSRRLKSPSRFPLRTEVAEFPTYRVFFMKAAEFECPVVCEELDFSAKKQSLGEKGRKYARMLSGWAYSEFYK